MFVSDSSPLIYLAALSDFEMLRDLFERITIPAAVFHEVVTNGRGAVVDCVDDAVAAGWIRVTTITNQDAANELLSWSGMHRGESEAIGLVRELNAHTLLADDHAAVSYAGGIGINVLRTPGIYRLAKARGRLDAVRPKLDALLKAGFYMNAEHYHAILELSRENQRDD